MNYPLYPHGSLSFPEISDEEAELYKEKFKLNMSRVYNNPSGSPFPPSDEWKYYSIPAHSGLQVDGDIIYFPNNKVKCPHCGQYGLHQSACEYCGAPID